MEYKDLVQKSATELTKMLAEERATLQDLRFKASVNQLKDVVAIGSAKKMIAQINTRLTQLEYENR